MDALLITLAGWLIAFSIFYAKEAETLSPKSLRFIKIVASIVAIATIVLGLGYITAIVIEWFK